jgi:hypothetical protein
VNLLEELFEAAVFGQPCVDLGKEFLGDVDGAGLAVLLEGEVLALVKGTAVVATAGEATATMGVGAERGSQDRRRGGELLEAVSEHAKDACGMVRDAHGTSGQKLGNE